MNSHITWHHIIESSWLDTYESLTVYLQFDSYEPGTALSCEIKSLYRTELQGIQLFNSKTSISHWVARYSVIQIRNFLIAQSCEQIKSEIFKTKEDKLIISVSTMIALISQNYHIWINEIKILVKESRVWQYVDSDIDLAVFKSSESLVSSDYQMNDWSAISKKELISKQQKK
jgi:hypothetical protein